MNKIIKNREYKTFFSKKKTVLMLPHYVRLPLANKHFPQNQSSLV